jgi:hypothetical protein
MTILRFTPPPRQSSFKYVSGYCAVCRTPLRDAARWLCDSCRAHQRLALALSEFLRTVR